MRHLPWRRLALRLILSYWSANWWKIYCKYHQNKAWRKQYNNQRVEPLELIALTGFHSSKHFNVVSTLSFGWYVGIRGERSSQRWNNVVYVDVETYNVEQRQINVVHVNVGMKNVRQRWNNVAIFKVEFHNACQCRNNVEKMIISIKNKNKSLQIEYTEFKFLATIS